MTGAPGSPPGRVFSPVERYISQKYGARWAGVTRIFHNQKRHDTRRRWAVSH